MAGHHECEKVVKAALGDVQEHAIKQQHAVVGRVGIRDHLGMRLPSSETTLPVEFRNVYVLILKV